MPLWPVIELELRDMTNFSLAIDTNFMIYRSGIHKKLRYVAFLCNCETFSHQLEIHMGSYQIYCTSDVLLLVAVCYSLNLKRTDTITV